MDDKCRWGLTEEDIREFRRMTTEHDRVMHVLFADNGEKGVITQIRDFFTRENEREIQKNKRDKEIKDALEQHYRDIQIRDRKRDFKLAIVAVVFSALLLWPILKDIVKTFVSLAQPPSITYSQPKPQNARDYPTAP